MLDQREVILVGLGEFGKSVSDNLVHMIEERRVQLGKAANSVILHTVNFENSDVFKSTDYLTTILDTVKDSAAKKMGEKFAFIFTGDMYESGTSKYAVDFAYLPYLMELSAALNHSEVLGFFTFASELGVTEKVSEESLGLICRHFEHLHKINEKNYYDAPFKDINNKPFKRITLPKGPFDRNYVLLTPGKSKVVSEETGFVFAERIFYELYYLAPKFNELGPQWSASLAEDVNSDKNLSCFSMVQIPRINEIQKYYLKYLLEDKIISAYLAEPLAGTDEEFYRTRFLRMLEIPENSDEFPMERAVRLFTRKYEEKFTHLLNFYISGKKEDVRNYVNECKTRIDEVVSDNNQLYDVFTTKEMNFLYQTIKTGFEELFKLNRLCGNIKTYIAFVECLKNKFEKWGESLERMSDQAAVFNLEPFLNKASRKVASLQKSWLFSFAPLIPIRQKLIENAILSVPVEKYLDSQIQGHLAVSIYKWWTNTLEAGTNPINECDKIIDNLTRLEEKLGDKSVYLKSKIKFIENMNQSYYIIPMMDDASEYSMLLKRIRDRNFGPHNNEMIQNMITSSFKLWVDEKDIFDITLDPTKFLYFLEKKFIVDCKNFYSNIEENTDQFFDFSKKAVRETLHKTDTLNGLSFQTVGSYLFENKLLLQPEMEAKDLLHEEIESSFNSDDEIQIPQDFSLGSVIYFQDYLYMSQESMKKKDFLDNYKNVSLSENKYDNEQTIIEEPVVEEPAADSNQTEAGERPATPLWKFTRAVLSFYMDNSAAAALYSTAFNETKEYVSDEEIDKLALVLELEDALAAVPEDKLMQFARENDIPLKDDREKQVKLIVHVLQER